MSQAIVSIRMDSELKKNLEAVCTELGLSMTTAFTIFAKKMLHRLLESFCGFHHV